MGLLLHYGAYSSLPYPTVTLTTLHSLRVRIGYGQLQSPAAVTKTIVYASLRQRLNLSRATMERIRYLRHGHNIPYPRCQSVCTGSASRPKRTATETTTTQASGGLWQTARAACSTRPPRASATGHTTAKARPCATGRYRRRSVPYPTRQHTRTTRARWRPQKASRWGLTKSLRSTVASRSFICRSSMRMRWLLARVTHWERFRLSARR